MRQFTMILKIIANITAAVILYSKQRKSPIQVFYYADKLYREIVFKFVHFIFIMQD
jgi:hypothetical protein